MEDLFDSLNNLTPVIAIGSLATFMTLERWLPYFEHGRGRGRQRWHNLGIVSLASRYGCVFSFREPREQTVWELLKMPFRSV